MTGNEGEASSPSDGHGDHVRAEQLRAEVLDQLDAELVDLEDVKLRIRQLADGFVVDAHRRAVGLNARRPGLHMCFTGPPGTGKTTVARRMADLLYGFGYLKSDQLVTASRADLLGLYVGHTAKKTRGVLDEARGGVLLLDDAYFLHREDNDLDFGKDVIEILHQELERDDLVVILAGYESQMSSFFADNPGLASRITHNLHFADYALDDLMMIGDLMLNDLEYRFSEAAREAFREYLVRRRRQQPRFANGRSVRNAIDRLRQRQARRLNTEGRRTPTKEELVLIEEDDVRASSVFQHGCLSDEELTRMAPELAAVILADGGSPGRRAQ